MPPLRTVFRWVLIALVVALIVAAFMAFSALIASRGHGLGDGVAFPP